MAQTYTDDVFDNSHVGVTDLQNIENNFAAIKSCFSGDSAPSDTVAGMLWFDTTNDILKLRNEADTAWLSVYDYANQRALNSAACSGISIVAGTGLSGGGALSANRTITHAAHTGDVTGQTALTIADGKITGAKLISSTAGTYLEYQSAAVAISGASLANHIEVRAPRAGVVTTRMVVAGGTGTPQARIYVNGVATGTLRTGDGTYTENITVAAGDLVQVYALSLTGGHTVTLYIGSANPLTWAADNFLTY